MKLLTTAEIKHLSGGVSCKCTMNECGTESFGCLISPCILQMLCCGKNTCCGKKLSDFEVQDYSVCKNTCCNHGAEEFVYGLYTYNCRSERPNTLVSTMTVL